MVNVEEILGMYVRGYISNEKFESWVYKNSDVLERDLSHIYLELISTNYRNKNEVITIKTIVKEYLLKEKNNILGEISDYVVQRGAEESKEVQELIEKREPNKYVEVNCKDINSSYVLHKILREIFDLGEYYGMNWEAFEDYIYGDANIPQKIIFNNWRYLKMKLPKEASTLSSLLQKYISNSCEVLYKE